MPGTECFENAVAEFIDLVSCRRARLMGLPGERPGQFFTLHTPRVLMLVVRPETGYFD